jgi:exosortase K
VADGRIYTDRAYYASALAAAAFRMKPNWNRIAQCVIALVGAFALKLHYSTASADQLRWILAPTTALVELVSGASFEFESHAGYISRERGFLIANSCSGVNFLIAAFLMLSLMRLLGQRSKKFSWTFIPAAAVVAYLATLAANTARITIALSLRQSSSEIAPLFDWMDPVQFHRFEGILIYFGFLLLLFAASEKMNAERASNPFRNYLFPLLVYYAMMLGVPLLNGAYRHGTDFWRHALFVLLIPLLLTCGLLAFKFVFNLSASPQSHRGVEKAEQRWTLSRLNLKNYRL